jgi:Kelch motif
LHGGRSNFVLEDVFVLDLVTKTWAEVVVGGEEAGPARHSHVSAVHDGHLYIYGGLNELGSTSDNMMVLTAPAVDTNITTFRSGFEPLPFIHIPVASPFFHPRPSSSSSAAPLAFYNTPNS